MPRYDYFCEKNQRTVEVVHSIHENLFTWKEVCEKTGLELEGTPADAPVRRLISKTHISVPVSNTKYKEMGFTKLVRRDKGVYENVTATGDEKRYVTSDDPSSMPHLNKKISD